MSIPSLGIVVIALDEELALGRNLPPLIHLTDDVVVSDGGSSDGSVQIARRLGARVVTGPAGRGPQLNRGARESNSQILLFLHADTSLPEAAPELIREALEAGASGGGFLLAFDSPKRRFSLAARLINARTRATRLPLGDQAQFVRTEIFHGLGGYKDWPILEDLDFACRLRKKGQVAIIPAPVTTASRRYEARGLVRTAFNNWLIWSLFALGVPARRLGKLYPRVR